MLSTSKQASLRFVRSVLSPTSVLSTHHSIRVEPRPFTTHHKSRLGDNAQPGRSQSSIPFPQSPDTSPSQTQSDLTPITISTSAGPGTRYIKRSYPKGKPEKLLAGLQRLLSASNSSTNLDSPSWAPPSWCLGATHDAIHLTTILPSSAVLGDLINTITDESDLLFHHPHISHQHLPQTNCYVLVVTCTTHVPYGLSLNDVKLADKVGSILARYISSSSGSLLEDEDTQRASEELVRRNEEAAANARANPHLSCVKHG